MRARDVMTLFPITVTPDHSVRHAARIMMESGVSGLPVLDDGARIVGLLAEGDLLQRAELGINVLVSEAAGEPVARAYVRSRSWKVGDVMTPDPVTIGEDTPLAQIAMMLQSSGFKRLPVLRNSRLVGIVSRADLLRAIATGRMDETAPGDEAIRLSILTRLQEELGLSGTAVCVIVKDGIVHLWGVAQTQDARDCVRVACETVRGVSGVVDHSSQDAAAP